MNEAVAIEIQVVDPVYLDIGTEPVQHIGTSQAGPRGEKGDTAPITFENLFANGDVGPGRDQVARGDHDHEIGDMVTLFNNVIT